MLILYHAQALVWSSLVLRFTDCFLTLLPSCSTTTWGHRLLATHPATPTHIEHIRARYVVLLVPLEKGSTLYRYLRIYARDSNISRYTVEPLYSGHPWGTKFCRYIGVAFIEGLFCTQTVHLGPVFLAVILRWPLFRGGR